MEDSIKDRDKMTSQQALCVPEKANKRPGISCLKLFIVALSFAYFSKALTGTYMKSSITQIERRFDLSSSHVGLIDGSFEMGNLLFLAVVSHFGAKLHRPRLIAVGCFLMAVGAFLTGMIHFCMGSYKYDTVIKAFQNDSMNVAPCASQNGSGIEIEPSVEASKECVKESGSNMWIYVFLGNALRGIGETPVTPLGISYIDDFAKAENSPFYIACLQTITLLGPMFGFLLGSYCAKLYVDVGYVDMESITISPKDARWVGAWWLGFLVSSGFLLISSIPFWFLPRSLPKQEGDEDKLSSIQETPDGTEEALNKHNMTLTEIAKGFLPSLKLLLGSPAYFLLICANILKFNSFIGLFTFKAKYIEQQFGQSASRANFLIGVLNLPVVAVGIFLGGLVMKRYKLGVVSGAQLSFVTSFMAFLLLLLQFGTKCDNIPVAGITVSYNMTPNISLNSKTLFSECNSHCSCSAEEWDPVCSDNGVTYISSCMAGCLSFSGHGRSTVFHNCSCVFAPLPAGSGGSARLGQCPHAKDCSRSFTSYMAVSVLSSFINSLGATPGYMVIIRCIAPELKSLALGIQTLATRTLGGIPAPIYFGALIDSTCLKWSIKKCGATGACRLYDSDMYRIIFLGLISCINGSSFFFMVALIILLRRQFRKSEQTDAQQPKASKATELHTLSNQTEDKSGAPKTPSLPHASKIWVRIATQLKEGGEVHRVELLPPGSRSTSTYTLETTVECSPHSDGAMGQTDGLESGEELKEGKYKVGEEAEAEVKGEELERHTGDSSEVEKETGDSKETASP